MQTDSNTHPTQKEWKSNNKINKGDSIKYEEITFEEKEIRKI